MVISGIPVSTVLSAIHQATGMVRNAAEANPACRGQKNDNGDFEQLTIHLLAPTRFYVINVDILAVKLISSKTEID